MRESGHCYLKQPQVASVKSILCQSAVEALSESTQVADQAAKAAKGQRARTCAGIPNLQPIEQELGTWTENNSAGCL